MNTKYLFYLLLLFPLAALGQPTSDSLKTDSLHFEKEDLEFLKQTKKRKLSSLLSQIWELDENTQRGTFKLNNYNSSYMLPVRWTDNPNRQPFNENPTNGQPEYKNYQNVEAMFQISLKSKIVQGMFGGKGDLWFGYTQKAYWQVYNGGMSRPFREMNYEPEVMFVMPVNFSVGSFKTRMFSVSLNHQSNGKEQVLSRSWNRLIFVIAHEWNDFIFYTNTSFRLTEKTFEDENPNIQKYIGQWRFVGAHNAGGGHTFSVDFRNNFSTTHNRSYTVGQYIFPVSGSLKGILQIAHGYGDSMIEYNHKQTSIGLGFVFLEM